MFRRCAAERPGLSNVAAVDRIQEVYLDTLLAYIGQRRAGNPRFMPRLLSKLTELRTLSAEHAQVLYNLKLEKRSLPPLLSEYFNVGE